MGRGGSQHDTTFIDALQIQQLQWGNLHSFWLGLGMCHL